MSINFGQKKIEYSMIAGVVAMAAFLFSMPTLLQQQSYATLGPGTCQVWASNEIQDKSSWYVAVCNPSVSGSYKSIELAFPPGYDVSGVGTEPIDQKGLVPGTLSVSGQVVKFTLFTPISPRTGNGFKLEIGHVINPSPGVPATYNIPVTARDSAGAVIEIFTQTPPTVKLELVDSLEILDHSITAADLKAGAVGTLEIADGSVSLADLGFNSVNSGKIVDGSVSLADLGFNSVNSGKIVDGSITSADIAPGALTVADGSITTSKLANGAVTLPKIGPNAVDSGRIVDNSITSADLATNSVGADEIAASSVGSSELATDLSFPGRTYHPPTFVFVPSEGTSARASFGISDVKHDFIEILCNDPNGCVIPSTLPDKDIDESLEGHILILSIGSGWYPVTIDERFSGYCPSYGGSGCPVNLGASSRTLYGGDDTLVLLFQGGRWTELIYQYNDS